MKPCRILAVEDDPAFRATLARKILSLGHRLDLADSGEEALGKYEMGKYDVMVVDAGLPRMSGIELIRVIRAIDDRIGVIVLTGWPTQEIEDACEGLTVWSVLRKESGLEDLDEKITDACELANMTRERETQVASAFGQVAEKMEKQHRDLLNETGIDIKIPPEA